VLFVALCGQIGVLAHGALVAHVTCGADGELIHVRADAPPAAPARDAVLAAVERGGEADDHCLLDEDGEAACPPSHVASRAPAPARRADHPAARNERLALAPAPLYRLAPKNSPPA
jgi:hypothetical protein